MNLYTPPTDNLYKFFAISGLIITLLSVGYPMKLIDDAELKMEEAKRDTEILKIELEYLQSQSEIIEQARDSTSPDFTPDESKLQVGYTKEEIKLIVERIPELSRNIKIKIAEIRYKSSLVTIITNKIDEYIYFLASGFTFGLFLTASGFILWYNKVQKYLDKEIKNSNQQ